MSKYLIAALIFAVAVVIMAGGTTPAKVHYADAGYSDDCDAYCLLYDYPHSTYHYSHYPYYWYGGRRYWGGQLYPHRPF